MIFMDNRHHWGVCRFIDGHRHVISTHVTESLAKRRAKGLGLDPEKGHVVFSIPGFPTSPPHSGMANPEE